MKPQDSGVASFKRLVNDLTRPKTATQKGQTTRQQKKARHDRFLARLP